MRKILLGLIVGGVLVTGLANAQGGENGPSDAITETVPAPVADDPTAGPGVPANLGGKTSETSYPPVPPVIVSPPTPGPGEHPPSPVEIDR